MIHWAQFESVTCEKADEQTADERTTDARDERERPVDPGPGPAHDELRHRADEQPEQNDSDDQHCASIGRDRHGDSLSAR